MERTSHHHKASSFAVRRLAQKTAFALLSVALGRLSHAQEPGQPLYTLHVYNNLEQFATVVLNDDLSNPQPIPRNSFAVTLDDGPVFHPTQMRRAGNDPIDLAVVLDAGGSQKDLLAGFADALAKLAPAFLHDHDRITIYAADCTLMRSLHNNRPDGDVIKAGVAAALNAPNLHGPKTKPACGNELHLWDYLTSVSAQLAKEPGRRVILLVSDGDEYKSKTAFTDVRSFVSSNGTAVFLMHDVSYPGMHRETLIDELVANSGGMIISATTRNLAKRLQDFVMLLRERYIIEFPRPNEQAPGRHLISITVPGRRLFLRYTGATTPLPDPALAADPMTLPSAESPAKLGTRRPLN